jgi:hypothetical protein
LDLQFQEEMALPLVMALMEVMEIQVTLQIQIQELLSFGAKVEKVDSVENQQEAVRLVEPVENGELLMSQGVLEVQVEEQ